MNIKIKDNKNKFKKTIFIEHIKYLNIDFLKIKKP